MPAAETGAAATAAGKPAAGDTNPLGLFAALLDLLGVEVPSEAAGTVPGVADAAFAVTHRAAGFTLSSEMAAALPQTIAERISSSAPDGGDAAPVADPPASGRPPLTPQLLTSFVEQLTALQDTTSNVRPLDPALEKKLTSTLDAVAAALGIPLPAAPVVDPALAAAAAVDAAAPKALDPLAMIDDLPAGVPAETAQHPAPTPALGATAAPAPGAILAAAGPSSLPALAAAAAPLVLEDETPAAADTATRAQELPPLVKKLADRILKLAEAVEPRAPGLAQRLHALAAKLTSGDLDPAILARFEAQTDADVPRGQIVQAIARLLAPGTNPKPLPETARFATAALTLPKSIAMPEKNAAAGEPKPTLAREPMPPPDSAARPNVDFAGDIKHGEAPAARPQAPVGVSAPSAAAEAPDTAASLTQGNPTPALPAVAAIATETRAVLASYKAPSAAHVNLPQVAFEIVRQVQAGSSRFEIRLDPPELGRIDVKLDMDSAGNVNAKMTVERAETLDLMQRDRQVLERALAQAGLDGGKTNLEFSLRQNPFGREGFDLGGNGNGRGTHAGLGISAEADAASAETATNIHRGLASAGGVNLFV